VAQVTKIGFLGVFQMKAIGEHLRHARPRENEGCGQQDRTPLDQQQAFGALAPSVLDRLPVCVPLCPPVGQLPESGK
jgi:hypothetical protein